MMYKIARYMSNKHSINHEKLAESAELLRAISHPLRIKMIKFIDENDQTNVNNIYRSLRLEQSITSQHLRTLRDSSIVQSNRNGKYIHYSLNYKKIDEVMKTLNSFFT